MITVADEKLAITPETKLKKVLEVYPQLEDVLIEMSPSFAKLKNPLLRKTVAKVATLQQIANVGGIAVGKLVNELRHAVGVNEEMDFSKAIDHPADSVPEWFAEAKVTATIDADAILDSGRHPLEAVGSALKNLKDGEILKLTSSFSPDPLIVKFSTMGCSTWTRQDSSGRVITYLTSGKFTT